MTRSVQITEDERNISRKAITNRLKQCYVTEIKIPAYWRHLRQTECFWRKEQAGMIDHYQVRSTIWDSITDWKSKCRKIYEQRWKRRKGMLPRIREIWLVWHGTHQGYQYIRIPNHNLKTFLTITPGIIWFRHRSYPMKLFCLVISFCSRGNGNCRCPIAPSWI